MFIRNPSAYSARFHVAVQSMKKDGIRPAWLFAAIVAYLKVIGTGLIALFVDVPTQGGFIELLVHASGLGALMSTFFGTLFTYRALQNWNWRRSS